MKKLKIKNRDAQKKRSGDKAVESTEQLNKQNRHQSQYLVNYSIYVQYVLTTNVYAHLVVKTTM